MRLITAMGGVGDLVLMNVTLLPIPEQSKDEVVSFEMSNMVGNKSV